MKQKKNSVILGVVIFSIVFLQLTIVSSAEHHDLAFSLLRFINQTRQKPADTIQKMGIDINSVKTNLGMKSWILDYGLSPVAWNSKLKASALAHANDMISKLYYSYNSPNGDTPKDRIRSEGYKYFYAGESLGVLSFEKYIEPEKAAKLIFQNMLAYETGSSINYSKRNILNENMTEIGISFVSVVADLGLNVPSNIYLVVADFARPVQPRNFLLGNVSFKTTDYPAFKLENTLSGMDIVLTNLSTLATFTGKSGTIGFYQLPISLGFFRLAVIDKINGNIVAIKNIHNSKNIYSRNENKFLDVFIKK